MHKTQKTLLKRLLGNKKQKYSSLVQGYTYENNIVFHLKQLTKNGSIVKDGSHYSLTADGIKEIMKFDLSLLEDTGFKSFLFGFLCEYEDEYLIKSHPQAESDFFNLPSGQPRLGEPMNEALVRSFNDNVGIKVKPANFKFLSLHIKTIKTSKSETMFDDAFVIYKTTINKEQKNNMKLHKQVSWMSLDKIKKLNNRWPEINDLILSEDTNPYKAYEFTSDYIL